MLNHYSLDYDNMGRIIEIDSTLDGLSTFTYDVTSQLTAADHASPRADEAYSFDDNGNRNMSGYTVGTNNRVTEDPNYLYEFDDEGNLIHRESKSTGCYEVYGWDHRNRLTTVTFYDDQDNVLKVVEHSYDALNRWIRRSVDEDGPGGNDPVDTFFAGYDGINPTLQFSGSAASNLDHRYLWGELVDQIFADEDVASLSSLGDLLWPLADHLGTLRDLAQHNQGTGVTTIANHRVYNAFGSLTSETNASVDHFFGFTAKPLDDSTGLQNNLFRWYSSDVGWWLSEDPLGFAAADSNLRRYVANAATGTTDPLGLMTWGQLGSTVFLGDRTNTFDHRSDAIYHWINPFVVVKGTGRLSGLAIATMRDAADARGYQGVGSVLQVGVATSRFGEGVADTLNPIAIIPNGIHGAIDSYTRFTEVYSHNREGNFSVLESGFAAATVTAGDMSGLTGLSNAWYGDDAGTARPLGGRDRIDAGVSGGITFVSNVATVYGVRTLLVTPRSGGTVRYQRIRDYGRTPTRADRRALGAQRGEVLDHQPPLVERFNNGDPAIGERPGYMMTPQERRISAGDRSRMHRQPRNESNSQGGRLSGTSGRALEEAAANSHIREQAIGTIVLGGAGRED